MSKLIENYIKGKLTLGGCVLWFLSLIVFPVLVWQMIEQFLKDLDITWPMYLMIALFTIGFAVGITVYKCSKVNPRLNVAFVLAGICLAFTIATVMVFIHYNRQVLMGVLYSILTLTGWWITFRTFFPIKKKEETA